MYKGNNRSFVEYKALDAIEKSQLQKIVRVFRSHLSTLGSHALLHRRLDFIQFDSDQRNFIDLHLVSHLHQWDELSYQKHLEYPNPGPLDLFGLCVLNTNVPQYLVLKEVIPNTSLINEQFEPHSGREQCSAVCTEWFLQTLEEVKHFNPPLLTFWDRLNLTLVFVVLAYLALKPRPFSPQSGLEDSSFSSMPLKSIMIKVALPCSLYLTSALIPLVGLASGGAALTVAVSTAATVRSLAFVTSCVAGFHHYGGLYYAQGNSMSNFEKQSGIEAPIQLSAPAESAEGPPGPSASSVKETPASQGQGNFELMKLTSNEVSTKEVSNANNWMAINHQNSVMSGQSNFFRCTYN